MPYQLLADQRLTNLCYDALNCLLLNAARQIDSPACSVFSERSVDAPPSVLCEKGKPVVRRGRKATGLLREIAGFPNRGRGDFPKLPRGKEREDAFSVLQYSLGTSSYASFRESNVPEAG
jgi:hypothetical protein